MSMIHLVHVPVGSLVHTGDGQVGVVIRCAPGTRCLEFPYRMDETADTPGKVGTYQQIAKMHDLVELVKTPTQLALDAALTIYDEEERADGNDLASLIVGKMIEIPTWETVGMVQSASKNPGSERITILLQEHPDTPRRDWQTYHLMPGEYKVT